MMTATSISITGTSITHTASTGTSTNTDANTRTRSDELTRVTCDAVEQFETLPFAHAFINILHVHHLMSCTPFISISIYMHKRDLIFYLLGVLVTGMSVYASPYKI